MNLALPLGSFKRFGHALLDTLLPPSCLACDAPVEADGQFCLPCFRQANFISAPFCGQCGVPLPFGEAGALCIACVEAPPLFTQARAPLRYDTLSKHLILPFKYADRTENACGLAVLMSRAGGALLAAAELLVPVPLHCARLRRRRYNQSVLLAAELGRLARRPVARDALIRTRATAALGGMDRAARQAELAGAIAVRRGTGSRLAARRVLLIDDVMTSGATANACAAALLGAGAARVDVLTATRVADPRFD